MDACRPNLARKVAKAVNLAILLDLSAKRCANVSSWNPSPNSAASRNITISGSRQFERGAGPGTNGEVRLNGKTVEFAVVVLSKTSRLIEGREAGRFVTSCVN